MKIIFVRHGETVENRDKIVQGHRPGKLSAVGIRQAKELALKLKDEKIDCIYASDLARAADTAKEIAVFHPKAKLILAKELRERSYGDWEGKKREAVNWDMNDIWTPGKRFGGGETIEEVYERMKNFALDIFKKHKNDTVLIIGHGNSGMYLLAALQGKPASGAKEFGVLDNAGLLSFTVDKL